MAYTFLSDDWLAEVKKISDEAAAAGGPTPPPVVLNLVVTGGPEGDKQLHVDGGTFGAGLLDSAPTKLTVAYAVAKKLFVDGDQAAGMQAFMSGQIKVEGDMSKLMAMGQGGGTDPAVAAKIKEITAE